MGNGNAEEEGKGFERGLAGEEVFVDVEASDEVEHHACEEVGEGFDAVAIIDLGPLVVLSLADKKENESFGDGIEVDDVKGVGVGSNGGGGEFVKVVTEIVLEDFDY